MKPNRLVALVVVMVCALVAAAAQEAPRLLFEVSVDGKVIARPEMRVPLGGEGRISLDEEPYRTQMSFTPTLVAGDLRLALTIDSMGRELKPVLRITRALRGRIELPPPQGAETFRIVVTWVE